MNDSSQKPVHFLQIWLYPDRLNVTPGYAEKSFAQTTPNRLHLIASKTGRNGSIPINQDADVYLGKLTSGTTLTQPLQSGRHAWVQVIQGTLTVNDSILNTGDAVAVNAEDTLTFTARTATDVLLFDLN